MSTKWRILALMTTAQAGASVVQQALGSLSPALIARYGLSAAQLGIVFTAIMLGSASCTAIAGILTDRFGERRILFAAAFAMGIPLALGAFAPSYPWLVVAMLVFGAGYATSTPAGGRAILSWFNRGRGFAMGIRQTGVPIGGTIGALSLPPLAHAYGERAALLYAAVVVVVLTLVAYFGYRESGRDTGPTATTAELVRGMRGLARDPRLIAVTLTCMTLVAAQLAMNAFVTVTGVQVVGVSAGTAALAFALAQAMAAVGRLWWGWASDRLFGGDRLVPLAICCVIAAAGAFALAAVGAGGVAAFFAASAVLGLAGAGWNGLMAAALAEVGGIDRAASALGLALTAVYGASAVAPTAFGALADATSLHLAWVAIGALALVGVVPVANLARTQRRR